MIIWHVYWLYIYFLSYYYPVSYTPTHIVLFTPYYVLKKHYTLPIFFSDKVNCTLLICVDSLSVRSHCENPCFSKPFYIFYTYFDEVKINNIKVLLYTTTSLIILLMKRRYIHSLRWIRKIVIRPSYTYFFICWGDGRSLNSPVTTFMM